MRTDLQEIIATFGAPERSFPSEVCVVCGVEAQFGYRNATGELQWFCSPHRLAKYWADARRNLRCVEVQEVNQQRSTTMDMREFASKFINVDNMRDGPIQTRVVAVLEKNRFGQPVLELEIGSQFGLNVTNNGILMRAWGYESNDWIGQELELFLGTYKDWESDPPVDKETVKVRAISPAKSAAANGGTPVSGRPVLPPSRAVASKSDDMDDSIPFVLAFLAVGAVAWLIISGSTLIA
jgi:hypothetical protein